MRRRRKDQKYSIERMEQRILLSSLTVTSSFTGGTVSNDQVINLGNMTASSVTADTLKITNNTGDTLDLEDPNNPVVENSPEAPQLLGISTSGIQVNTGTHPTITVTPTPSVNGNNPGTYNEVLVLGDETTGDSTAFEIQYTFTIVTGSGTAPTRTLTLPQADNGDVTATGNPDSSGNYLMFFSPRILYFTLASASSTLNLSADPIDGSDSGSSLEVELTKDSNSNGLLDVSELLSPTYTWIAPANTTTQLNNAQNNPLTLSSGKYFLYVTIVPPPSSELQGGTEYDFDLTDGLSVSATAIIPPAASLSYNGLAIADNESSPTSGNGTDFGAVILGNGQVTHTFTVTNTGGSTLDITGNSLTVPNGFDIGNGLPTTIAPGVSQSFTVYLSSGIAGDYSGDVTFKSTNNSGGTPVKFAVMGDVITPAASDSISISNGIVSVTGTESSDTIAGGIDPNDSSQYYFSIQNSGLPEVADLFPTSQVTGLLISCDPASSTPSGLDADLVNLGGSDFGFPVSVFGGAGSDTVMGQKDPNYITTGVGSIDNLIYGSIGNDTLVSMGSNDTLRSGGGTDSIVAISGDLLDYNDIVAGGKNGSDIFAGAGDTIRSGAGNSTVHGGAGGSLILGGFGDDDLIAGSGFDTVIAGSGQSTLVGGTGDDFLGAGWDSYLVLAGGSALPAPTGHDSVDGSASVSDTLVASSGTPTLIGGSGNNDFDVNDTSATLDNVNGNFVAKNDTVSSATQTITVNLTIQDSNSGVVRDVVIPDGAGAAPSGISAAEATDASGTVVFSSVGPRTFTLGDFFNHWGVDFNAIGIGQFIASAGSGHSFAMTVNGVNNTSFNNYVVQNGDDIVITFTQ